MKTAFIMSKTDIRLQLHYQLVYEATSRGVFKTGRAKRMLEQMFTEDERNIIHNTIIPKARKWSTKGVPDKDITITIREFNVWKAFERYCSIL